MFLSWQCEQKIELIRIDTYTTLWVEKAENDKNNILFTWICTKED